MQGQRPADLRFVVDDQDAGHCELTIGRDR